MPSKKEKYPVSPQEMHVKPCIHEQVVFRGGQIWYEKWGFSPKTFPCGGCKSSADVVFYRVQVNNKVVQACTSCGVSQPIGPRNTNTDAPVATLIETRVVTIIETSQIVNRIGMRRNFLGVQLRQLLETPRQKQIPKEEFEAD